ncbi:MAG: hypothetical protein WCN97_02400 [Thermoleophilia bacterium]
MRQGTTYGLLVLTMLFAAGALAPVTSAAALNTGWTTPYSGTPKYLELAPTQAKVARQINAPLGAAVADRLAASLGFDKSKTLSPKQYAEFISGQGNGGGNAAGRAAAELTDSCVRYLTNSSAAPMTRVINGVPTRLVLGSYGLIVNPDGMLESPANTTSPCRQINWVIAPVAVCRFPEIDVPTGIPCGYMGMWMRRNRAIDTLKELYTSAYVREAAYGSKSQGASGIAQLVVNEKRNGQTSTVGMSMVPSIWITNFLLIYALSPKEAAKMPAYWTAIPAPVATAISSASTGQVPYADYAQYFAN